MSNDYTLKNATNDGMLGLFSGMTYTALYSLYRAATDQAAANTNYITKAKYGSKVFGPTFIKLSPLFVGTSIIYRYGTQKGYGEGYSLVMATIAGIAYLSFVKI